MRVSHGSVACGVSIHAPRVGRDRYGTGETARASGFNSRAPRGARPSAELASLRAQAFQFTRPAWGATHRTAVTYGGSTFQFTRPAWGATLGLTCLFVDIGVSIHAPRVGRDRRTTRSRAGFCGFNSRAPRGARRRLRGAAARRSRGFNSRAPRGARPAPVGVRPGGLVSIHAPRVGRDRGPRARA